MKNSVYEAQVSLRAQHMEIPELAMVSDEVRTCGIDPSATFHLQVKPMLGSDVAVPFGVHRAVGGRYNGSCPGDLLCAALGGLPGLFNQVGRQPDGNRTIALEVQVKAAADLRGAMGLQKDVPVGFQSITCNIHLKAREGTPPDLLDKLRVGAQRCCVVGQTLLQPPQVKTLFSAPPFDKADAKTGLN